MIYRRDGKNLFILPELPQWFVVDEFGAKIVSNMISGTKLKNIIKKFPSYPPTEIRSVYKEIKPLLRISKKVEKIEKSLTSKTTAAMVSITRKCNLKCPHCYVDAKGSREYELTLEDHKKLANNLYTHLAVNKNLVYMVNITGGEPFTHPDILQIIEAYKHSGFEVTMSTNGLLIRDELMKDLKDMGVVLSVSLDGASNKTHDFIRGKGAFKKVIEKIDKLVNTGIKVGINSLVHHGNFEELDKTIDTAYKLGCKGFNPINLVQMGRAHGSKLKRVSEAKIFRRISTHLEKNFEEINMFMFSSLFASLGAALLTGVTCQSCGIGNRPCVYVAETGDIYPCPNTQKEEFKMGNFRIDDFAMCVDFDHPVLKAFREIRVETINEKCGKCNVRYFCGGDCRGETYNVTHDLRAPYVACEDRKKSIIELMWIVSEHPEFFEDRANEYLINSRAI